MAKFIQSLLVLIAAAVALAATASASTLRKLNGHEELVTIVNKCKGMDGYVPYVTSESGSSAVPAECIGEGNACSLYTGDNPAFFLAPEGNVAAVANGHTRAELNLNLAGSGSWINISKVTGFNAGVAIDVVGSPSKSQVCTGVNCKDSYLLCDTAVLASHNPVNKLPLDQHYVVTFCPYDREDTLPAEWVNEYVFEERQVEEGYDMYWCACGSGADTSLAAEELTLMVSGTFCGPL